MKKALDKTVLFLGLLTIITGFWISALTNLTFSVLNQNLILVVLAVAFANCSTKALKIVGYSLSAILGTFGVKTFIMLDYSDIGTVVMSVGQIIMSLAAVIYLVKFLLQKHVSDCSDELAVLYNRAATHECGQEGTTHFYIFLTVSSHFIKIIVLCRSILAYISTQTNTEKLFFDFFNAY